jgi:hypothetical protein
VAANLIEQLESRQGAMRVHDVAAFDAEFSHGWRDLFRSAGARQVASGALYRPNTSVGQKACSASEGCDWRWVHRAIFECGLTSFGELSIDSDLSESRSKLVTR